MFKQRGFLFLSLLLSATCQEQQNKVPSTVEPQILPRYIEPHLRIEYETGDFDLKYAEFGGQSITLVSDGYSLSLRMPVTNLSSEESRRVLDILRQEVEQLTQSDHFARRVGQSVLFLRMQKSFPLWEPYTLITQTGNYECLRFAWLSSLNKQNIVEACGQQSPNSRGYYPYKIKVIP